MSQVAEKFETYVSSFERFRREPGFGPELVRPAREAAFSRFVENDFPTTRDEEWKFTSVGPIAKMPFERAGAAVLDRAALQPYLFDGVPAIVIVNGRLSTTLSAHLPVPVHATTLASLGWILQSPIARRQATPTAFTDLNAAFFEDGVVIEIPAGAIVETPIQVLAMSIGSSRPSLVAPRVIVRVGEHAQCTLIESYASAGTGDVLTTAVTEITLADGAVMDHVRVQRESTRTFHMSSTFVEVTRSATFTSRAITFGGKIARNDIVTVLAGEGAECTLDGLYVAGGDALIDTHTTIDHAQPHCPSHEVYKGILGGRARAVFNGKIVVRPQAQKTDAKQTNKALLLTPDAQVNTKPQLEIFADDVKCTHGAAIGQLDDDAMFYLRARAIGEDEARAMLIHAFAGQVIDGIKTESVRTSVQQTLDETLAAIQ